MWDAIEEIAKVKMVVNMARTSMGCKWERGWFEFVRKVWRMESPGWGWDELNCIYVITAPFTRGEYVGETKGGEDTFGKPGRECRSCTWACGR
jgi:hypothetical protein